MTNPAKYLIRGTLKVCLNYMFTHWAVSKEEYLSIIHHKRGHYYAVVNDYFLDNDQNIPEVDGTRLIVRTTIKELKIICTYYTATQTELQI